jgi:hypothetical protein
VFYRVTADLVVLIHIAFVLFVVLGALTALRWPRMIFLHLPAAVWGALIEFKGWICPLTPLENHLRTLGGQAGYAGGFIEHYLLPLLYPSGLTRTMQSTLGLVVLAVNGLLYALVWVKWRRARGR